MKINFYNIETSKASFSNETACIHPNIIIADKVMYRSVTSWAFHAYKSVDHFTDEMIIHFFSDNYKDNEVAVQLAKNLLEQLPLIKTIQKIKHKDKKAMMALSGFKSVISNLRKSVIEDQENLLRKFSLFDLLPFVNDAVLELQILDYKSETNTENEFIKEITNTITERENIFSFDSSIDELMTYSLYSAPEDTACDFIKIPLWDFPPFVDLTYEQIKFTRENLQLVLDPFKTQLKDLSEQIFNLSFTPENIQQIKQLSISKFADVINPVQTSINESLYLSQMRNQFPTSFRLKFCLGITSAENLVNYFEKIEIILPYVASEIKQQISRFMDINATYAFTYFEVHGPPVDDCEQQTQLENS